MTFYNIATGQYLSECDFYALVKDTNYTCCSQSENVWIAHPNNLAFNEYQWQQYFLSHVPSCGSPYTLTLRYSAGNAPVQSLNDWNTQLAGNYTAVSVIGNDVILTGGSGVDIPASALIDSNLVQVTDDGSVNSMGDNCLAGGSIANLVLSAAVSVGNGLLGNCPLSNIELPACTALGSTSGNDGIFTGISGQSISAIFNIALATNNAGQPDGDILDLYANNDVTTQWDTAPVNTVAPVLTGNGTIGSTVSCSTGTWTYLGDITYSYQWKRGVSNIGTNSPNYTLVSGDAGAVITCVVTATTSAGSTPATSSNSIQADSVPVNTVAPAITGTNSVGSTLTVSNGTWTANGTITYAYQWRRGGSPIGGATASTYTLVQADAAATIDCVVTATTSAGSTPATSSNSLYIYDTDANAFISAASITDNTQKTAVNKLVADLKGYSIWTKMKAIYPIVGGTAASHKWNLKDPQDTNAAFRLVFTTGWTHSANGMTPNGTSAYADTFLNAATVISNINDGHLSYYSRTNNSGINQVEIGNRSITSSFDLFIKFGSSNLAGACINMSDTNTFINTNNSIGLYHANQNNTPNVRKMFWNGSVLATQTVSQNEQPNLKIFIGARNFNNAVDHYSNRQCAFASIGNGLTDTEAANFYTAVQAFQTTLNRQV